jgi:small subunit ribosomal protein S12
MCYHSNNMPTLNQLVKNQRQNKLKKPDRVLGFAPQRKGICKEIIKKSPKKPNSANRSCAKIILTNNSRKYHKHLKKEVCAYIPYENHNLKAHSSVLIAAGRKIDLPGVNYKIIRGNRDLGGVLKSRQGRSLKGNKKPTK